MCADTWLHASGQQQIHERVNCDCKELRICFSGVALTTRKRTTQTKTLRDTPRCNSRTTFQNKAFSALCSCGCACTQCCIARAHAPAYTLHGLGKERCPQAFCTQHGTARSRASALRGSRGRSCRKACRGRLSVDLSAGERLRAQVSCRQCKCCVADEMPQKSQPGGLPWRGVPMSNGHEHVHTKHKA